MAKYIQSEKSRYENNEYPNMPSVGYFLSGSERLTTKNRSMVDWDCVDKIVKKYGLHYTTINDTFCCYLEWGVFQTEFVLYFKTELDSDYIDSLEKNGEYDIVRKYTATYDDIPQRLHDCVHELDEQTPLFFDNGWAGNCGRFGSDDVKRNTYSFGDRLHTWRYIEDRWSPLIHDTNMKLKKGVYFFMTSRHLKTKLIGDDGHNV